MATSPSEAPPFRRLLVAGRGASAVRVMRACRELGIATVAVHTDADRTAPHVRLADAAHVLGPDDATRVERLLAVARAAGAEAVHPGAGLLAGRADLAHACADAGLVFVGSSAAALAVMDDPAEARRRVARAGVPVVSDPAQGAAAPRTRRLAVPVLGDRHGDGVHLPECECWIQRRDVTVIAEAPSPAVEAPARARLGEVAVAAARALGHVGLGTVVFQLDAAGGAWFVAMEPGLQDSHAVTEAVTGIDLVRAQLAIAAGRPLPVPQDAVALQGWAIGCRVCAEDPAAGFQPTAGRIEVLRAPAGAGIRDDAGVCEGAEIQAGDDPLLSTVVAWAPTRAEAIARIQQALAEYTVLGPTTDLAFHHWALAHPAVVHGDLDADVVAREYAPALLTDADDDPDLPLVAAAIAAVEQPARGATRLAPTSRWVSAGRAEGLRG